MLVCEAPQRLSAYGVMCRAGDRRSWCSRNGLPTEVAAIGSRSPARRTHGPGTSPPSTSGVANGLLF